MALFKKKNTEDDGAPDRGEERHQEMIAAICALKKSVDDLGDRVRRAGIVSGVIAQRGPGADFSAGFSPLIKNIEEILDKHFD